MMNMLIVCFYSLTLFSSAALLFVVQPLAARLLLPVLGSSPSVWNACMVFFQASLLAGYAYAHASIRLLGPRRQPILHLTLVAAAAVIPAIALPATAPPDERSPIPWLLEVLLVGVGGPAFVLASTAPLLQRWLAGTIHPAAANPYFLYVASNFGSLLGLAAYPLWVEPHWRLAEQASYWSIGYRLFGLMTLVCAVSAWRLRPGAPQPTGSSPSISWRDRLLWVALAAAPTSLLLGVTEHLTTDVASAPLLWMPPLALYLITFIFAFSRRAPPIALLTAALPWCLLLRGAASTARALGATPWLGLGVELAAFFFAALLCHAELARRRPPAQRLTEFYLCLAVGGLAGGVLNGLAAPLVFQSIAEYPLALLAVCLLAPAGRFTRSKPVISTGTATTAVVVLTMIVCGRSWRQGDEASILEQLLLAASPAMAFAALFGRPLWLGLLVGLFLFPFFGAGESDRQRTIYAQRSFFGVHRVTLDVEPDGLRYHRLRHGTTNHGWQCISAGRQCDRLAYYHAETPMGEALAWQRKENHGKETAVVGLGAGATYSFCREDQRFTFFEIDPVVRKIAEDPRLFTYLSECPGGGCSVVLGDGRRSLSRVENHRFSLIVLDAFTSDSIPIHLLTREALAVYREKLTDEGVIIFHISNWFVNLEPMLGRLAADGGLVALAKSSPPSTQREFSVGPGPAPTRCVVMARRPSILASLALRPGWRKLEPLLDAPLWEDDFSNLFDVLVRP